MRLIRIVKVISFLFLSEGVIELFWVFDIYYFYYNIIRLK